MSWRAELSAEIARALRARFEYGTHDCVIFAARCARIKRGGSQGDALLADWSGQYSDRAGAEALLAARGGLEAAVTQALGAPLPSVLQAGSGDLALLRSVPGSDLPALGVVDGPMVLFAAIEGLTHVPLSSCDAAWRVRPCRL